MSENVKTKINILRPEDVWQPKIGAQHGNRNAWKNGHFVKEVRDLKKQVAAWKRTTRTLLQQIEKEFPSPPLRGRGQGEGVVQRVP